MPTDAQIEAAAAAWWLAGGQGQEILAPMRAALGAAEALEEPVAYAIYGRTTGWLRDVAQLDEEQVADLAQYYDVVPLYRRSPQ